MSDGLQRQYTSFCQCYGYHHYVYYYAWTIFTDKSFLKGGFEKTLSVTWSLRDPVVSRGVSLWHLQWGQLQESLVYKLSEAYTLEDLTFSTPKTPRTNTIHPADLR
jgi:hypothetical protein